MYDETCCGIPKVSNIKIPQSLRISVLDLLDFSNTAVNSLKIQRRIRNLLNGPIAVAF